MAVTLVPFTNVPHLTVAGDIEAVLAIPVIAAGSEAGETETDEPQIYFIALSDGTLVRACYGDDPAFAVVVEGAGRVTVDQSGTALSLDWTVEWINLGPSETSAVFAAKEPPRLPLLELLDAAA